MVRFGINRGSALGFGSGLGLGFGLGLGLALGKYIEGSEH